MMVLAAGTVIGVGTPDRDADWWTTTDVAAYLGVTVSTVSAYRSRGQMPAPDRTIGRTHVWTPARIIEWNTARPGHGGRPPDNTDRRLEHAPKDVE
jgi:predicted DNA-binding transcriptional regulator AlpA